MELKRRDTVRVRATPERPDFVPSVPRSRYNRGMSEERVGGNGVTQNTPQRLIVSVIVIGLLSGGCQGCARPRCTSN